jgi:HrpA-like RNA helicase
MICVTQPRRVAAITVAKRVAEELGCLPGTVVGHRVRFDDHTEKSTRIMYATDGMLLREATSDPLLSRYGVVVLDEAHERSLQTDILFGVVKRAMEARNAQRAEAALEKEESRDEKIRRLLRRKSQQLGLPPVKVVVMSATLDIETFKTFFPQSTLIKIPGRQYPVQVVYTKHAQEDYIDAALSAALQIHADADDGDILVFLPGQEEIEDIASLLKKHLNEDENLIQSVSSGDVVQSIRGIGTDIISGSNAAIVNGVLVCVLYAALPPEAQLFAFQPKPEGCTRKIILATNIAETSVTLDGIRYVLDCGKHKTRDFSAATGMESLTVKNISKAQAAQRTGRAGRVASGVCFRLYTEDAFDGLEDTAVPEILRVNLAQVVLQLKGMGVNDPRNFDFLTPPSQQSLQNAFELLFALEAVDSEMQLTDHGKRLAKLPLDPVFGHLLLQSSKYGCTSEMLTVVSMLSAENIFYRPGGGNAEGGISAKAAAAHRRFASHEGDLPTLLNVYQAWRNEAIYIPIRSRKAQKKRERQSSGKLLHGEWCVQNYISGRALTRAYDVRHQLSDICGRDIDKNGLGMDVSLSCGPEMTDFLKCACAGLFMQVASRIKATFEVDARGRSGTLGPSRGRYRTKIGSREVSIHPTSSIFGRNPAPKCVVYTELLTTKKTYIRGVTQVREEWLVEVAPHFFKPS